MVRRLMTMALLVLVCGCVNVNTGEKGTNIKARFQGDEPTDAPPEPEAPAVVPATPKASETDAQPPT